MILGCMEMKLKKLVFIFVLICIIVFFIFYYIFSKFGNNKVINQDEFVDNILNMQGYEANIEVKVTSNKNENYYEMFQYVENNNSKFIVNSPDSIKGMTVELENHKLRITNTKINMEKIYDNYEYALNNNLFLNTFIQDYKNNDSYCYEEDDKIILKTELSSNSNTYIKFKELYLDKKTGLPKELIIKDNTKNTYISIIYNDIKIK